MEYYKTSGKGDPDYQSYNSALELNEEEDKRENLVKVKKIIEEEYNREMMQRQDHIEQIELQICKARKLLHLLRYAIIMSYYKKKELEYCGTEEETSNELLIPPDQQSRIHPALKKLLGNNMSNLDHLNLNNKRKSSRIYNNNVSQKDELAQDLPESKKIKLEVTDNQKPTISSHTFNTECNFESKRSRKKAKYRLVVGNISKWMPSSEDDLLTHKWMVYVRGPKDKPDISSFVEKVVYYLHPSYKPYDVVEVSESPFHLSRRGWGEFPVRVQIFFRVTLNKPIDVVHNIKLDKTYSGRQTLGNETLIDVFLYDNNVTIQELEEKSENSVEEHDYCCDEKAKNIYLEHSYSLLPSQEGLPRATIKEEKIEQDLQNNLIFGLDSSYEENNDEDNQTKTLMTINSLKQLVHLNKRDIKFNNTKIIVVGKKFEGSFMANLGRVVHPPMMDPTRTEVDMKVRVPFNRIKNLGEALPYLFKRLPLFSEQAHNSSYKFNYPFTASSLKEFVSWNVGKRRNAEWSRARTIKKILLDANVTGARKWNTKAILMFGRSHEFTPFISYGLFNRDSEEKRLVMNSYSDSTPLIKVTNKLTDDEQDVDVNVDSDVALPVKVKPIDITDPSTRHECSYIRQTALECGIILKPEEMVEGFLMNGAELMILEAVKCLADNLIRRARNHRVCTRNPNSKTCTGAIINKEDVQVAINERPEILSLRHFKNERRNEFLL